MGHGHGGIKAKAQQSANDIDAKGDKAKSTDPEAEVGVDAMDMGTIDPFQILSGLVLNLIEAHIPPVKHCLDVVTVNEGAARAQADLWKSQIPGELLGQHGDMLSVAAGVAANWASSGDDTAASVEFLARHAALQELIRAVSKACQGVGWLIEKATDLMVKVRDKIKQWIAELFAKIMERAMMALATSWIPFVDVATTAEFVIESAIRIAAFIQEAYALFQQVKSALNNAKQVLADVKDGIDQIHDILGAMGVDVPALTALSKGVEAISEPINKASEFADGVDDKMGQTANSVGEIAGAVNQIKGKKPGLTSPRGGHEQGAGGSHEQGGGRASPQAPQGGGSPAPWHQGGSKPQPGDSAWQHGPGGGYKGSAGAAKPLPHVDGKPADPRQFAAMASQGKSDRAAGAGHRVGASTSAQGGAGAASHASTGPQHHSGAGLSAGTHLGGAGAASAGTHSMGAAPVAERQSGAASGPQPVRDHGSTPGGQGAGSHGTTATTSGGQGPHGAQHHPGPGSTGSGPAGPGSAGPGTGASRDPSGSGAGGGRAPHLSPSGSTGHDPAKSAHTEAKPPGSSAASEHSGKPAHTEAKTPSGPSAAGAHHDQKHAEQKHVEAKPAGAYHDDKHATAGHQHHDDKHVPSGQTPGAGHHDDHKHAAGSHQTGERHEAHLGHREDPVHSHEQSGDGWHRLPDDAPHPEETPHGVPLKHHWESDSHPRHNPETAKLVADKHEPYGHHPDGTPYTKSEYDERFNKLGPQGQHWQAYPENAGAAPGSRVQYDSMRAVIRDYGSDVDRIGPTTGKYLGVMHDGAPDSFEKRSLPVASLNESYHKYELTGDLPPKWTVEIARIAPAFGRNGGGVQMLVRKSDGGEASIEDLLESEVLR
ncbi:putative methyl-accepting chemotaxis sensory transducer [Segniliparus rotundus DSM 44985]|uniref:Putative methyl-accepting chemotaxis sensory transducer n=1 Tax=Segniliparus rotundus (strain ATCC BAA-972 / CDC 1076 / CIP 108378 / DSM 44985 / JCM 13578) TaxID=640132 RepID=D6ZDL9_SEGRD|nr:glycohydrolase toxin TNT-related protein [Segniliparus rotundus]ADG99276.1 putative methyl-accepting chemotaxis sensory transducer [Segniliparus rotundus DSM 44985]